MNKCKRVFLCDDLSIFKLNKGECDYFKENKYTYHCCKHLSEEGYCMCDQAIAEFDNRKDYKD
jgi:hypothetical protein